MTLKTVPVTGILYNPNGSVSVGTSVVATLTVMDTDGGVVVPTQVPATTDSTGSFTLNLWPNSRGVNGSQYRVRANVPGALPGVLLLNVLITVPDSDPATPVPISTITNRVGPAVLSDAVAAMLAAQAYAVQSQGAGASATAAAASASAAAGSALSVAFLYPLQYASSPTTRPDGSAIQNGDRYNNSTDGTEYIRINGAWTNAANSAQAAASSAAAASTSAGQASTSASSASSSAGAASTSATQAGNYAAAAANGAKFYDTIALGLAGVTSGNTFGVKSGGSDGLARPTIYRNDSGSATFLYQVATGADVDSNTSNVVRNQMAVGDYTSHKTTPTIGTTVPNTTTANPGIYGPATLVGALSLLTSVSLQVAGAGSGEIHVYKQVDSTHWQCTNVVPVTFGAAGVVTYNAGGGVLPNGVSIPAGGFVAFKQTGAYLRYAGSGVTGFFTVTGDTGVGSTVTTSTTPGFDLGFSFTLESVDTSINARVGTLETGASAIAPTNALAQLIAAAFSQYMVSTTLGAMVTSTSGALNACVAANNWYVGSGKALLTSVSVQTSLAGSGELHVYDQVDSTHWKCTYVIPVTFGAAGVHTWSSANGDFASTIVLSQGSFVAFKSTVNGVLPFGGVTDVTSNDTYGLPTFNVVNGDTGVGSTVTLSANAGNFVSMSFTFQTLSLADQLNAAVLSAVNRAGANYGLAPLISATNAYSLGDSTVATYRGGTQLIDLIGTTRTKVQVAVPGDTIAGQKNKWQMLTVNPALVGWVIIQIGLNDLDPTVATATTIAALQDLVNTVRATIGAGKPLLISQMTPCRSRLIFVYGSTNGPLAYQKWLDINTAIAGGGSTPITGVDARITAHVAQMNDGTGNLLPQYDTGDGIHPTTMGRQLAANAWVGGLASLSLVP